MPNSVFKGYALQDTASNIDTWGDVLNEDMIEPVDINMGGILPKTLASSNVLLTADEAAYAMLSLSGSLSDNVQVTNPNQGFYFVENLTSGSFSVTLTNGVGSAVTVPQSTRCAAFADTANGVRLFSIVNKTTPDPVPTGTRMLFTSEAVPTGWSLVELTNDTGMVVVTSTGAVVAGVLPYTTVFGRTATDSYTLQIADIPAHDHVINTIGTSGTGASDSTPHWSHRATVDGTATGTTDNVTGGGQGHTHPLDLRIQTVTVIIGERID